MINWTGEAPDYGIFAKQARQEFTNQFVARHPDFEVYKSSHSRDGVCLRSKRSEHSVFVYLFFHHMYEGFTIELAWSKSGDLPAELSFEDPPREDQRRVRAGRILSPDSKTDPYWWWITPPPSLDEVIKGESSDPQQNTNIKEMVQSAVEAVERAARILRHDFLKMN